MEVIAITTTHVITRSPSGTTVLIRASDIDENHPLVIDKLSYRLGVIAAHNTACANDEEGDIGRI